jgi:hypothetical protein
MTVRNCHDHSPIFSKDAAMKKNLLPIKKEPVDENQGKELPRSRFRVFLALPCYRVHPDD